MNSVEENIIKEVDTQGRGQIYFASDFVKYGSDESIRKALSNMVKSEVLIRLAQGIYLYPKKNSYIDEYVMPSLDTIAHAIARRDRARIIPVADNALNILGLSTQVPQNAVYQTDGVARHIKIYNGHGIQFIRTAPRNLQYKNELTGLVVSAIREIGDGNLSHAEYNKIKQILISHQTKADVLNDMPLAPIWVRKIILSMYE